MKSILSPDKEAFIINKFPASQLKKYYPEVDIERFTNGLEEFYLLECSQTKLKFFYPQQLEGDGKFYAELSQSQKGTYYPEWRWAHTIAFNYIPKTSKVLEIGSGGLGFILEMTKRGVDIMGLEINPDSIIEAKRKNINLVDQTIQEFGKTNANTFDVVCFFEVLEHIYDVHSFLNAALHTLKPGGQIIFSVPNNSSYLGKVEAALNNPPHHMVLWDEVSIKNIEKILPLKFVKYHFEPLPRNQVNWFLFAHDNWLDKIKVVGSIYYRFKIRNVVLRLVKFFAGRFKGQTVVAVFKKTSL